MCHQVPNETWLPWVICKKAASPTLVRDPSTLSLHAQSFSRICQVAQTCTPIYIIHDSSAPPSHLQSQMADRSVQPFLHTINYIASPHAFPPKFALIYVGECGPQYNTSSFLVRSFSPDPSPQTASRLSRPFFPNSWSLPTDRQTDRPTA